ncbi:MAG TPA: twitching motility protein PilT [Prolixibacteraceae bacterium]|nr:twitching motility protein PilT [Prolixibacteraceae bacterium]
MRRFIDANILFATLNKEYPLFTWSSRLLSLQGKHNIELFISPLCLAIAFYFSSKKSGEKRQEKKIEMLRQHIRITTIDQNITDQAIQNKLIHDFENGLEYYSAIQNKCNCIITENQKDFYFIEIEAIGCEAYIMQLQLR